VQSYIVNDSVDPSTITFGNTGPTGPTYGVALRSAMYSTTGSAFVNKNTAITTGLLTGLPLFDFAAFTAGDIPAGSYNVGYACTVAGVVSKFWNVVFTFATDVVDPLGVTWTVGGGGGGTTTSSSTTSTTTTSTTTTTTIAASTTTTTAPIVKPNAPRTLVGVPGNGRVTLTWLAPLANAGPAPTAYAVQKSSNNGVSWVTVTTAAPITRTYAVTGLVNGASYRFRVAAINGGGTGPNSSATGAIVPFTVPGAPGTPVGVAFNSFVTLTWAAPASNGGNAINAYRVERSTNGVTWTVLTSTASATTRTYNATGLTNAVKYRFRVSAHNSGGYGTVSHTLLIAPKAVPRAPGKPVVVASSKKVKLSWAAPSSRGGSAITGYRVQRSLDGINWTTLTSTAPVATRTYTATGLTNGRVYRFRVGAINSFGLSPWSAIATATPR
jgi:hypothetical protein